MNLPLLDQAPLGEGRIRFTATVPGEALKLLRDAVHQVIPDSVSGRGVAAMVSMDLNCDWVKALAVSPGGGRRMMA